MSLRGLQLVASPRVSRGRPLPLGTTPFADGINFALLCRHGTHVWLVLSPKVSNPPSAKIELPARRNRTGDHWHVLVQDLPPAFRYGWRVDGPPGPFHRYDPTTVLLDPAATLVAGGRAWGSPCERHPPRSVRRGLFKPGPPFDRGEGQPPLGPAPASLID